jgi:hypothetical protein
MNLGYQNAGNKRVDASEAHGPSRVPSALHMHTLEGKADARRALQADYSFSLARGV